MEVPEIQTELKFTNDDRASLHALRDEFKESGAKFEKTLAEAAAKGRESLVEALMARSKEVDQQLAEVLGERTKRFQELRRQAFGIMAANTSDAVVRDALGVTEDQRSKFNAARQKLVDDFRNQSRRNFDRKSGKVDDNVADQGMRDFASGEDKLFADLMTDAQKTKWKELIGAPIEMPQEVLRFVRRGRFEAPTEGDRPAAGDTPREFKGKRKRGNRSGGDGEKKPLIP